MNQAATLPGRPPTAHFLEATPLAVARLVRIDDGLAEAERGDGVDVPLGLVRSVLGFPACAHLGELVRPVIPHVGAGALMNDVSSTGAAH